MRLLWKCTPTESKIRSIVSWVLLCEKEIIRFWVCVKWILVIVTAKKNDRLKMEFSELIKRFIRCVIIISWRKKWNISDLIETIQINVQHRNINAKSNNIIMHCRCDNINAKCDIWFIRYEQPTRIQIDQNANTNREPTLFEILQTDNTDHTKQQQ